MSKKRAVLFVVSFILSVLVVGITSAQEKTSKELAIGATVSIKFEDLATHQKEQVSTLLLNLSGTPSYISSGTKDSAGTIEHNNVPYGSFKAYILGVRCLNPITFSFDEPVKTVILTFDVKRCALIELSVSNVVR